VGEGGSGGALAIAVADRVMMLEYGTYSVISPEGCASILWKDASKASDAAQALGITSKRLRQLGLIDQIIPEPLGGAHRDYDAVYVSIREALVNGLRDLKALNMDKLLDRRYQRLMSYGKFEE
ncbi:MAG: acetyl-CoA carboxylase carboxyl transferase subunit alpha, partial [Thiotrichaceae bacterium]